MSSSTAKKILVISGPTGSGESTLTNELLKHFANFTRLVTATTRPPRSGEENGTDYYFMDKEKFLAEIKNGNILEHTYVQNRDQFYGTYRPDLEQKLAQGLTIVVNPDLVGTRYFKERYSATTIFVAPESLTSIAERLKKRDPQITPEELSRRLKNAASEINNEQSFYDFVVINRDGKLTEAFNEIVTLLKKEGYELN